MPGSNCAIRFACTVFVDGVRSNAAVADAVRATDIFAHWTRKYAP
jgi:hypothetical protein